MRNSKNFELYQRADDYLTLIEDAIFDLDRLSVDLDDMFNSEIFEMRELVKRARKQLI